MSIQPSNTRLNQVLLERAYSELEEDEQRRQQMVRMVRQWMAKQPHLQRLCLDDFSILCFARGCKYSMEKVKMKLDLQFTLRTALPEFFSGRDPMKTRMQEALACGSFLPLPGYDQHGRKVIVIRPGCFDPCYFKPGDIEKANFMVSDIMGREEEHMFVMGMVIIVDCCGYTLNHFTQRPLPLAKKHMSFLQSAPISPKTINLIRANSVVYSAYSAMTHFLKDKIKQRVKIHGPHFQSLYEEIDRKILPKDYGGEAVSLAELTGWWKKKVEDQREFLIATEKDYRVDETRRPGKSKTAQDIFGIEGSFRKLTVD